MHEVCNGLAYAAMLHHAELGSLSRIPPLCIVPCGSGNNLALNINIQTIDDAIAAALGGRVQLMDVIQLTHPEDLTAPRLEHAVDTSPPSEEALVDHESCSGDRGESPSCSHGGGDAGIYKESDASLRRCSAARDAFYDRTVFSVNTIGFGLGVVANKLAVESLRLCGRAQYMVSQMSHCYMMVGSRCWVVAALRASPACSSPSPLAFQSNCICLTLLRQPAVYIYLLYNFSWLCEFEIVNPPQRALALTKGQVAVARRLRALALAGKPHDGTESHETESDSTPCDIVKPLSTELSSYCMMAINHTTYFGCVLLIFTLLICSVSEPFHVSSVWLVLTWLSPLMLDSTMGCSIFAPFPRFRESTSSVESKMPRTWVLIWSSQRANFLEGLSLVKRLKLSFALLMLRAKSAGLLAMLCLCPRYLPPGILGVYLARQRPIQMLRLRW